MDAEIREELKKKELVEMIHSGGGFTTNGLDEKLTGKKFLDFVAQYFKFKTHPVDGSLEIMMCNRVLFLKEHVWTESSVVLSEEFDFWLQSLYGISLCDVLN